VPAGVLAAHAIGYVIAYRDAQYRADVLASTGHGYFGHAVIVGVIAAAVAVSFAVARGLYDDRRTRWRDAAVRIGTVQTAAFFGVEILERIAAGLDPFAGIVHVAFVGAVVQLFMGGMIAALLIAFERAGRTIAAVAREERSARPARRSARVEIVSRSVPRRFVRLPDAARAPPFLLAST
jgi:hypothetical protein